MFLEVLSFYVLGFKGCIFRSDYLHHDNGNFLQFVLSFEKTFNSKLKFLYVQRIINEFSLQKY